MAQPEPVKPEVKRGLLSWAKMGVAVAMIRLKPPNLSARQYAENVSAGFLYNQLKARKQIERAQLERQKKKMMKQQQAGGGSENPCSSLDLFSESQMDTNNDDDPSQTTPAADSSQGGKQNHKSCDADKLLDRTSSMNNHRFLQSVLDLKDLVARPSSSDSQQHSRYSILQRAISCVQIQASAIVSTNNDTALSVSDGVLHQSAQVMCQLLHTYPWLDDSRDFMKPLMTMLQDFLHRLSAPSTPSQFPPHRRHKVVSSVLVEYMCGLPAGTSHCLLDSLVESLEFLCRQLADLRRSKSLDVDLVEVGYFTVECLAAAVTKWKSGCQIELHVLEMVQKRLEKAVFDIIGFPLVKQSVCDVIIQIESILQNE